jgi:hypothetical protein
MRTTIDLPDDLFRRAKSEAALRGISLEELVVTFVDRGLNAWDSEEQFGHDRPFPVFFPSTGVPIPSLTNAEIDEILLRDELEKIGKV